MRKQTGNAELKRTPLRTFVQCPHCREPFNLKAGPEPVFVTACRFCRRLFQVVGGEPPISGAAVKKSESASY